MRNILQNIILGLSILVVSGCATTVHTIKLVPAEAVEVPEYKTVAVLDFHGNRGRETASNIESIIAKAEVNNKKIYTVVDRDNINKILSEQKFQMTMANDDTIVDFGELIGAEAIWSGFAESKFNRSISYETRSKCSHYNRDGKCMGYLTINVPCETRNLYYKVAPKLTSVSTGKVVYSRIFESNESSYACQDESYGWFSENQLYKMAENKFLRKFRTDIAPYVEEVSIVVMSNKNGTNDTSLQYLKSGIAFIKENRVEKACELWGKGLQSSPDSIALLYNMGVCAELTANYKEALDFYKKAENASLKPVKEISNAIERNKVNIENQEKLKQQM